MLKLHRPVNGFSQYTGASAIMIRLVITGVWDILIGRGGEYEIHSFGSALLYPDPCRLHRSRRFRLESDTGRGRGEEIAHRRRDRDMERTGGLHGDRE